MNTNKRHWANSLVGTPWTPENDCWWLVRRVFKERFDIDLPPVRVGDLGSAENVQAIKQASTASGWRPVDGEPHDGDIVLMRGADGARHVGVMIDTTRGLRLLHADGHMTAAGPVGSVVAVPLSDAAANGYGELELWRRVEP